MRMTLNILLQTGLILFSSLSFAETNLACDLYKSSPNYTTDFVKPSPIGWTEDGTYQLMPGTSIDYQLKIIDEILAYQNERKRGCLQAQKPLDKMYSNKRIVESNTLRMTLAIGYNDDGGGKYVWDDYLYRIFFTKLTARCESPMQVNCGFSLRMYDNYQTVLTKSIWGGKNLEIVLFKAAITVDDAKNRNNPEQVKMSDLAQARYHSAFADSQFVFYIGHSRNGGGPDFAPPKVLPDGHTAYDWYQQTKINSNKMVAELSKIALQSRPLVFSILGCNSRLHYGNRLRNVLPNSTLILSRQEIYTVEFYEGVLTFINGLQFQKSSEDMNIDLEAVNIAHRMNGSKETSLLFLSTPATK